MKLFTVEFWIYAGERAIKTIAQTGLSYLGGGTVGLFEIDWLTLASVSLGGGLLSIMTSLAKDTNAR